MSYGCHNEVVKADSKSPVMGELLGAWIGESLVCAGFQPDFKLPSGKPGEAEGF
jgi:hypothetical protein